MVKINNKINPSDTMTMYLTKMEMQQVMKHIGQRYVEGRSAAAPKLAKMTETINTMSPYQDIGSNQMLHIQIDSNQKLHIQGGSNQRLHIQPIEDTAIVKDIASATAQHDHVCMDGCTRAASGVSGKKHIQATQPDVHAP